MEEKQSDNRIPTADMREWMERIEELVTRACVSAERAADMAMQTHEELKGLREITASHDDRIKALELRQVWMPLVLSGVSTLMAFIALLMVILMILRGV